MDTKTVIAFLAGAGLGTAITWLSLKRNYEKSIQEEVASLRETFNNRLDSAIKAEKALNKPELVSPTYEESIKTYSVFDKDEESPKEEDFAKEPYYISADEFAKNSSYDKRTVVFYVDDEIFTDLEGYPQQVTEYLSSQIIDDLKTAEPDEDLYFVRNEAYGLELEIERKFIGYGEGLYDEDD